MSVCGVPGATVAFSPARSVRHWPSMKTSSVPLEHLVALFGALVDVHGWPAGTRTDPVDGLQQVAVGVRCAARDLPAHRHPRREIEHAIALDNL